MPRGEWAPLGEWVSVSEGRAVMAADIMEARQGRVEIFKEFFK